MHVQVRLFEVTILKTMSLSFEKIYKRKPSIIIRQQLLKILLRKYIKKVYCGILADKKHQSNVNTNKSNIGRQLLRQEYYNDINECLLNYCQLNKIASAKLLESLDRYTILTNRHQFIESIKKKRGSKKINDKKRKIDCAKRVTDNVSR